jgi:hypothetical protein
MIGPFLQETIFSLVGQVCLYGWYRDSDKIEKIKVEKYHRQFSVAGWIFATNFFIGLCVLLLFGGLMAVIFSSIRRAIIE